MITYLCIGGAVIWLLMALLVIAFFMGRHRDNDVG